MECNRDEALKAKELAEKKLSGKDLVGAKKYALKAQSLFPDLDGVPPLLATLDVFISGEKKVNGEVDWYGVLGVDPSTDDNYLRKQYRKLALILHPDKNKTLGADGAFKILSEAWSLLSDKAKRAAYDQKRYPKEVLSKATTASVNKNGNHPSAANNGKSSARSQKSTKHPKPDKDLPVQARKDTFWTACTLCRMQYEYLKVYLNKTLVCPHCQEPFNAMLMPPPQMNNLAWPTSHAQEKISNQSRPGGNSIMPGVGQGAHSASLEDAYKCGSNSLKRNIVSDTNERHRKRDRQGELKLDCNGVAIPEIEKGLSAVRFSNTMREPFPFDIRNMLMEKATKSIGQYLHKCNNKASVPSKSTKPVAGKEKEMKDSKVDYIHSAAANGMAGTVANSAVNYASKQAAFENSMPQDRFEASSVYNNVADLDTKSSEINPVNMMTVPDPDFHDFDNDRNENSFDDNQVWAAYDDDDGMPRYYALIHSVMSRNPFKMRISWLNSKSNAEFGSMNWIGSGFYKTCGDFRVGKYETNKSINSFSHKVSFSKGTRGAVQIYPKKGDVWALYRNWSTDWSEHTPDELIHKYDMVEVVEDYDEEKGIVAVPLVKVAGYKTVFRQPANPQQVKMIPKEEMFRFSHQVPSSLLTGKESPNAPKGCWELDPAATPLELLNVITEDEEQAVTGSSKDAEKV